MIVKVSPKRGSRPVGLMRYLFGPGRRNEHTDPHVIAAADGLGVPDGTRLVDKSDVVRLGVELDAPHRGHGTQVRGGHVWHCSISNPRTDRTLTDAEWAELAREVVDRLGFSEASGRAPCRWVAVHHGQSTEGNDHIHLVVNLVREDGTKASIWNDWRTLSTAAADFERRYGLTVVAGRTGAGMPGVSRAETEIARRAGRPEPDRLRLARMVRGCATAASNEAEFVGRLRETGTLVRPRYVPGGVDEVVGYSVAARPPREQQPVWFGGGRLGADLTLPRLRAHWDSSPQARAEALAAWHTRSPAGGPAGGYSDETWRQASEVVARVCERLAAVPVEDWATWAGVARETSGVLAAWSLRVEPHRPGPLAHAADVLARSAQTRHGQPRASRRGAARDLRGVAMVALAGSSAGRGGRGQLLVLRQLTHVLKAVHDAHAARGEARAAAALATVARDRLAALHRAPIGFPARSGVAGPGWPAGPRRQEPDLGR